MRGAATLSPLWDPGLPPLAGSDLFEDQALNAVWFAGGNE